MMFRQPPQSNMLLPLSCRKSDTRRRLKSMEMFVRSFTELRVQLFGLLMALGVTEPIATPDITMVESAQLALVECYRSGQMEEWAWQEHIRECPELKARLESARTQA